MRHLYVVSGYLHPCRMVGQSTVFYKTPPNEHAVDLKTTFTVGIITVQEGT